MKWVRQGRNCIIKASQGISGRREDSAKRERGREKDRKNEQQKEKEKEIPKEKVHKSSYVALKIVFFSCVVDI